MSLNSRFLATLNQKLGQKLIDFKKRTRWLRWIELSLKEIVMPAIALGKNFIQNLQRVGQLLLEECFENTQLSEQQTLVYLKIF